MARNLLSMPLIITQEERYCEAECTHKQNGLHVRAAVLVRPHLPIHHLFFSHASLSL